MRPVVAGLVWACLGVALVSGAEPTSKETPSHVGRKIAGFELQDYLGAEYSLKDFEKSRFVVVAFLGTECPLSKVYGKRLDNLSKRYKDRGVAFVGINSNQQDTPTKIAHYVRTHEIDYLMLKDPGNQVADQFQAERTPEVFVLDQKGVIRYWGQIDDQFGVGFARPESARHYLVDALDELLAGKEVSRAEVEPDGCYIGRVVREEPRGDITYSNQISRILQSRCVSCHRQGGVAPFSLTSYDKVSGWAETIREVIQDQRMPPWHVNAKYGEFSNDSRMPEHEKQLICRWVENGIPEGDPEQLPPEPEFVEGWRIGEPDLVVTMPEPFTVPATGVVPYQYIVVDPKLKEDKWVKASEALPGQRSVVHHIIAFVQPPGAEFSPDQAGVGFEMIGAYVPGMPPMVLPDGTARLVPAGSKFVFQMHYTPDGSVQKDQSQLGLVFADPHEVKKTVQMGAAVNFDFEIPPHAENHRVESSFRISHDTLLYSLTPHMHYRGKSFRYEAIYPNGRREVLLDVPNYDFNWQNTYRLARPKYVPAGTLMHCIAHFDNSEHNLSNPDPTARVTWGEQTWDEMMIGYYEGMLVNQDLSLPDPEIKPLDNGNYEVRFSYRPDRPAKTVHLAGTFNDWSASAHAMHGPDDQGRYHRAIRLKAGTYRYKFVVDGNYWTHDPASGKLVGVLHESLLVVGEAKPE